MSAPHDQERQGHQQFATQHGDPSYRPLLEGLHQRWTDWNESYFDGALMPPHIGFDVTAARSLGGCAPTTSYGGLIQISINCGLAFGTNADWVNNPKGEGHLHLVEDLLLRFTVRQFVLEVRKETEEGYGGYGPKFAAEANRIGKELQLGAVKARRRGHDDAALICAHWPHCVRSEDFYGADVTPRLLALGRGGSAGGATRRAPGPSAGFLDMMLSYLRAGQAEQLERLLSAHRERLGRAPTERGAVSRKVESGEQDLDGSPLGEVRFDADWLGRNEGLVRKMVGAIVECGTFGEVPFLADALEAAGCREDRILRHLRADVEHTARCWVLRGLMGQGVVGHSAGPGPAADG